MAKRGALARLTLTQQWALATCVAVLPLIVAVGYAAWSLAEQTDEQRRIMLAMSSLKELDGAIHRQVSGLERASLQYALIDDARFRELYDERLAQLRRYQQQFVFSLPEGSAVSVLNQLIDMAADLGNYLTLQREDLSLTNIRSHWQDANELRSQFSQQVDRFARNSIQNSQTRFEMVIQHLLTIGIITLIGTLLLISLAGLTVARPLRRLASAIRRLGRHDWAHPVAISGPADLVELGNRVEWMRQQLVAGEEHKQTFMQHITHELKSPLAAIIEAHALLQDEVPGEINSAQRQVLNILHNNARDLSELIQQLLNYNQVRYRTSPDVSPINIRETISRLIKRQESTSHNSFIDWEISGTDGKVMTDPMYLEMIISNLLTNSRQAVPDNGKIYISWGINNKDWWLQIDDNGPGITISEREFLFTAFYQGKTKKRGPLKGSGIGLAIVWHCVNNLNGTIEVSDSDLGGAKFYLQFPKIIPQSATKYRLEVGHDSSHNITG